MEPRLGSHDPPVGVWMLEVVTTAALDRETRTKRAMNALDEKQHKARARPQQGR